MVEKLLVNHFTGDETLHPDLHLIYVDEVCGLFKLAGIPDDVVNKKAFPLSLKGEALTWYRLCDDMGSWDYKRLKLDKTSDEIPFSIVCSSMTPYHHIAYTMSMHLPSKIRGRPSS